MGEKEIRIKLSELDRITIVCGRCRASVTFLEKAERSTADYSPEGRCPSCGTQIQNLGAVVAGFRELHRLATDATKEMRVELVIRLGEMTAVS